MRVPRPSHATVVAYLALIVAIGGTGYAASKIGTNDIRNGAITSPKIKKGAVRASDVKKPIVRTVRRPGQVGIPTLVQARCKKNELLIGGGGGWDNEAGTVASDGPSPKGYPAGPVQEYYNVRGISPVPNTLEARALCLPK